MNMQSYIFLGRVVRKCTESVCLEYLLTRVSLLSKFKFRIAFISFIGSYIATVHLVVFGKVSFNRVLTEI